MDEGDGRDSPDGTLTIVLVVVVLLLALPCLAVAGVFAMRLLWVARLPAPIVQPVERVEPMAPTLAAPMKEGK